MSQKNTEKTMYVLHALTNLIATNETKESNKLEVQKVFTFFMREKRKYDLTTKEIEELNLKMRKLERLGMPEFITILKEAFKVDKKLKNIFLKIEIEDGLDGQNILTVLEN